MRWSKNTRHLLVFQNKALPLQSNRKSTPQDTAKYGKNPVEQQREITSLAKRYIKDIQPLIVRLRFLVAPLLKKEKRCKSLNFKEVRGFFISKNRQNQWDQSKLYILIQGIGFKNPKCSTARYLLHSFTACCAILHNRVLGSIS